MPANKINDKIRQEIVESDKTATKLAFIYDVSPSTIRNIWREAGRAGSKTKERSGWHRDANRIFN